MISLNVHVRQELAEWVIAATLVESHGAGLPPDVATTEVRLFLTDQEWSQDPLTATWSALQRWSGVTTEDRRLTR